MQFRFCVSYRMSYLDFITLLLLLLLFTVAAERFVLHFAIEEHNFLKFCPLFCMDVKLGRSDWKNVDGGFSRIGC